MTKGEKPGDQGPRDRAFVQSLIFGMQKILEDTNKDVFQISATRYGRLINGIKNGSRETLDYFDIRAYTYHLELIRRNWPQGESSGWVCNEISGGTHLALEFKRVG
jgi:hypothetical protein